MPIICLFGPDGSGKTTLARRVSKELRKEGREVRTTWMRGSHTLASVLAKLLSKLSTFQGGENPYYNIAIPTVMRRLWQAIEFLSALPVILFRFVIPAKLGRTVVCDRYAPDLVAWISMTTDDRDYPNRPEAKFLLKLSSLCDCTIYIYASRECLRERRAKAGPELGSEQIGLYSSIARSIKADRVDTTHKSSSESLEIILDRIGGRIN